MIQDAEVYFTNGNKVEAERVRFKEGGWVSIRAGDGWVYYPDHAIGRVVSRDE